jgi:hypothetical protein
MMALRSGRKLSGTRTSGALNPGDYFGLNVENGLRSRFSVSRTVAAESHLSELAAGKPWKHQDNLVGGEVDRHQWSFVGKVLSDGGVPMSKAGEPSPSRHAADSPVIASFPKYFTFADHVRRIPYGYGYSAVTNGEHHGQH